jgi:hypothetical protein
MDIRELRDRLRQPGARTGVGVWLMPHHYLGHEAEIAIRVDIEALDAREAYLKSLPEGARFSGLTRPNGYERLTRLLHDLTRTTHQRDCLLVHTLDLLLLGLEVNERQRFWSETLDGLPYPRTRLILAVPEKATEIIAASLQRRYTVRIAFGTIE